MPSPSFLRHAGVQLVLMLASWCAGATEVPFHAGVARLNVAAATPFEAIVWYPSRSTETDWRAGPYTIHATRNAPLADGGKFAVVVLSHGHAGSPFGHRELAARLAREGFVVIAPTHVGDASGDTAGYAQGRALMDRPHQAELALDTVLRDVRFAAQLDAARIGMIGFSAGGYTALAMAGAVPDFTLAERYCATHAQDRASCGDRAHDDNTAAMPAWQFKPSHALKAIVLMDPLAILFDADALKAVRLPVLLYHPADSTYLPALPNATALVANLPEQPRDLLVPGRHFVFLDPCPAALAAQAPVLCDDAPGVDRAAIHRQMEDEITAFLHLHL